MKDNFAGLVLTAGLLLSVLAAAFLSYRYVSLMGRMQVLQAQMTTVNRNVALMNALASESIKYGEKNKAIEPILQSVGARPGGAPAPGAPAKPAPAQAR